MRRIDLSKWRTDAGKSAVSIKCYQPAVCYLMTRGTDLLNDGEIVKCLEFINHIFFSKLEMVMGGVVEALTTFEQKCK